MADDHCRLHEGSREGWRALTLSSGALAVTVLPDKGAEIVGLVHVASGVDVLFRAPWGLQPPGAPPRDGSDGHAFLENYGGGWQELFPSAGDACTYGGRPIPFHGEVAGLPWDVTVLDEGPELAVAFSARCRQTPFRLERIMRLVRGSATLALDETATNESDAPAHLVWGHHCVVGPPFLDAGAKLHAPARTIVTIPELWEDTARLEPGQRSSWPLAALRGGGTVDLRDVPGCEAGSHDDVYLTDLDEGWVAVESARLGLAFRLDWDPAVFRWIVSWQPYGGARVMPLAGAYALGIEPWTTRLDLEQAVAAGEAVEVGAGQAVSTRVTATVGSPDAVCRAR